MAHCSSTLLETNLSGVFAVGDVRGGGDIKCIASAMSEGSIAIPFVHQMLQE
jgi:thioredoxin reductase (NADPH)